MSYLKKFVLMAIKPKYVSKIYNRTKQFEFRKRIWADKNIDIVFIYSSSPIMKITGYFIAGQIIQKPPTKLWQLCSDYAGIERMEFLNYFKGKKIANAIPIKSIKQFTTPYDPYKAISNYRPPQSFSYIEENHQLYPTLLNFMDGQQLFF